MRLGLCALLLAAPAAADPLCVTAWDKLGAGFVGFGAVSGTVRQDGDWCLVEGFVLDLHGQYLPDWHIDRLRVRGPALGWLLDGTLAPEGLEVVVDGLHFAVETGHAQTDWLLAAQGKAQKIRGEAAVSWDAGAKVLRLEGFSVDFPGENLVEGSALLTGVDLSSDGAMQISLGSFALTEADLRIVTHGLFEGYLLMPLGTALLPYEGDIDAAAEELRAGLRGSVAELSGAMVSEESRAALVELIDELPNPSGELVLSLRAAPGIGPGRLVGPALNGIPGTLAEAEALLQGVVLDVGWTHADAP